MGCGALCGAVQGAILVGEAGILGCVDRGFVRIVFARRRQLTGSRL